MRYPSCLTDDLFPRLHWVPGPAHGQAPPRRQTDHHTRRESDGGARDGGADRRALARRPHQRRGARDSRRLLRGDAQIGRAVCRDVQEGEDGAGAQIQGGAMRISRDKLNKLAHTVADTLAEIEEVGFNEDRNTIRQEARKALENLLAEEVRIDNAARQKIASQRKIILEGSQEWDILYRKYYNDEVRKLGI